MSNDALIRYFEGRPFVPFSFTTIDGRQFEVRHPEHAMVGLRGESVLYIHPDQRLELIEAQYIVSLLSLRPASFDTFG